MIWFYFGVFQWFFGFSFHHWFSVRFWFIRTIFSGRCENFTQSPERFKIFFQINLQDSSVKFSKSHYLFLSIHPAPPNKSSEKSLSENSKREIHQMKISKLFKISFLNTLHITQFYMEINQGYWTNKMKKISIVKEQKKIFYSNNYDVRKELRVLKRVRKSVFEEHFVDFYWNVCNFI